MSALEARIRRLAREEIGAGTGTADDPDRVAELEKQLTELTNRVQELEKNASAPTAKRATRKATEPSD